jgi:hypothetical protein
MMCASATIQNKSAGGAVMRAGRHYWAAESIRVGTNWRGLIGLHFDISNRLQAGSVSS